MFFGWGKRKKRNLIRFEDEDRGLVLYRYGSGSGDLPLLRDSRIRVERGQQIALICGGRLTDVWDEGEYVLNPETFPLAEEAGAFSSQPVGAELYYINTNPITERKWATKTPALVEEKGTLYRVRAYGTYDFRVTDPIGFVLEAFVNRGLKTTYEVVGALATFAAGAFTATACEMRIPVLDLINHPREISELVRKKAGLSAAPLGIELLNVLIEGTSLPD
ncbi:MAG: SPFH domain-containing protein [Lachnospiraceae bacterium]|nr:SPFH domain-containing protein [Lachnospiraceae bacterium]